MPGWDDVLREINLTSPDFVRYKYLDALFQTTGRNIICYYSGWLQKPGQSATEISDDDMNGFMNAVYKLDRKKGLDLFLHTPGGGTAATEKIVDYIREMFGTNVRAIVPQLAMSGGTMIACSCKSIILGKQSSLGPVDPQFRGIPAQGVIEEFHKAIEAVRADPTSFPIWQIIIGKYHPTFIGQCEKAIEWSEEIVTEWLKTGMFKGDKVSDKTAKAKKIANWLTDHKLAKTHDRHISLEQCIKKGLVIERLEELPNNLQDKILTVHHAYMHTFSQSNAMKIIENHKGKAFIVGAGINS